jgi:hypothetical protein
MSNRVYMLRISSANMHYDFFVLCNAFLHRFIEVNQLPISAVQWACKYVEVPAKNYVGPQRTEQEFRQKQYGILSDGNEAYTRITQSRGWDPDHVCALLAPR